MREARGHCVMGRGCSQSNIAARAKAGSTLKRGGHALVGNGPLCTRPTRKDASKHPGCGWRISSRLRLSSRNRGIPGADAGQVGMALITGSSCLLEWR